MADLRRKQVAPPTDQLKPVDVNLPGLRGQIPFKVSKMILTDAEKQVLKTQFGWKDGDPVPNLSEVIKAQVGKKLSPEAVAARAKEIEGLQEAIKETPPPSYPDGTKDLVPPSVITIENLTPEKRREIEESIQAMKQQVAASAQNKNEEEPFVPRDPSIQKAQQIAALQAEQQRRKLADMDNAPTVELQDDREAVVKPKAKVNRGAEQEQPATSLPPPPATEPTPESRAGAEVIQTNCPHCGWDLSKPDEAVVTDEDKRVFTAAILGGKRFVKTYSLMDGAVQVTFRAPTSKEANLIIRQLYIDGKSRTVSSPAEVFRKAQEYQLAICLQSVHSADNAIDLPPMEQHELDQDETTTGLPDVLDYTYNTAVQHESFRRILLALYSEFDGTLSKLEVAATKQGFWKATEQSR